MIFKIGLIAVILACLCTSSVTSQPSAEYKCISYENNDVKVSINNRRNRTGHLISQVEFEHSPALHQGALTAKDTNLWTVDVEQRTDSCEGVEYVSHLIFTITAPFRQPTSGYKLFPGIGYYKFHAEVTTWPLAREICAEEGAHLVIINSEKESEVTKTLFTRVFTSIVGATEKDWSWVGVREKEGVNGQYFTLFGVPLADTGFSRWSPGQPGDPSTGDYILVHRTTGGLGDVPVASNYKVPFICEQEVW